VTAVIEAIGETVVIAATVEIVAIGAIAVVSVPNARPPTSPQPRRRQPDRRSVWRAGGSEPGRAGRAIE